MKVAFVTENPFTGKVPRDHAGRTDTSWMVALDAIHFPYSSPDNIRDSQFSDIDLCVFIVPKKEPSADNALSYIESIIDRNYPNLKVAIMQEGPHTFYQDYDVRIQLKYLDILQRADLIMCHNEQDYAYYTGISSAPVFVFRSLMIEDAIPKKFDQEERTGVMIGGNMVSWYGGMDSLMIATQLDADNIYAPSMGRKTSSESNLDGLNYLPYLSWPYWLVHLNKRKFGVHLMRTFAAGTFALNCARLGIPCIGWGNSNPDAPAQGCDTQRILFPELTVPIGDMNSAQRVAQSLKKDDVFYNHVSAYAKHMYEKEFSEAVFLERFKSFFSRYL